ncbi:NADH-quinone oxidoreductase subunit J [Geitlerinema splendidum]|jgi:NADH-quinone oxidoreductase subunit J|nr:NADH-quinone oxidoreductase subunit J [Geitlerinema splendidum]
MFNIAALLFYIFSGVLLTAALMVVTSRNTVHGVLFLIVAFFNAAGLFVLAGAEFLAMILVVVYVGAVAVLFLFVVMMLNTDLGEVRQNIRSYSLIGAFIGGVLLAELLLMGIGWHTSPEAFDLTTAPMVGFNVSNTQALGNLLYTHYTLAFQGAGLVLLVAMIGAIVLTLRHREGVRRQKVGDQQARQAKESLRLVDIPSGSGV